MLTKLTLTIDKYVIEKAKEYAQQKNKSVSRIVEEYLKNISQNRNLAFDLELKSPITDSLVGMFEDNGKDYKTMLEEARSEKFS
jgi:antitoxin component of RelBE/YafQ-DinJ toxin-antitoxin module